MSYEIRELLRLNVEMEGLLRVLAERENIPALESLAVKAADFDARIRAFLDAARPEILKEDEAEATELPDSFDAVEEAEGSGTESQLSNCRDARAVRPDDQQTPDAPQTPDGPQTPEEPEEPEMPVTVIQGHPKACGGADLSRTFSINDRYLYSRELFGGNMQRFQDALAGMSRMPDFAHALEYMTGTLGLDLSMPVAKEFADRVADKLPK